MHIANLAAMSGVTRFGEAHESHLDRGGVDYVYPRAAVAKVGALTPLTRDIRGGTDGSQTPQPPQVSWFYWKNETLKAPADFAPFTHVLAETRMLEEHGSHRVIGTIDAFRRIDWRRLRVVCEPAIYIMEAVVR